MASKSFGGTVKLTGESEYQKALKGIADNLRVLNSEMKVVTSKYDENDNSVKKLTDTNEVLNKKIAEQENKVSTLKSALAQAEAETGQNSATTKKWQVQLNEAEAELNKLNRELANNSAKLDDARKQEEGFTSQKKYAINSVKDFAVELVKGVAGVSDFGKTLKSDLSARVSDAKEKVANTAQSIKSFGASVADTVAHPKKLGEAIKGKLVDAVEKLEGSTKESADAVEELGEEAKKSEPKVLSLGDVIKANLISEGIMAGIKGLGSAIKSVGSAFVDIGKQAVASYAEYEQLVGGVETLFGTRGAKTVEEYAQMVGKSVGEVEGEFANLMEAQEQVISNANNAYAASGMSANQYMETVTSFSASLISSLDGDTVLAAEVANRAIIDMSDNANKMGTDIQSIQNAYQGFAKQNYTMLDNLKLGYGGTKAEMERLIADAATMTDVQKELGITINDGDMSFANIANAISVVQANMGIMGTTADEAGRTITGSTGAMKAAWQNLVTGIADDNADFETLVNNLVESIVGVNGEGGVINNILPRIQTALDGIVQMVVSLTDTLLPQVAVIGMDLILSLTSSINENLPALLGSASAILDTLISGILSLLPSLLPVVISLIETLCFSILENLPMVLDAGISIIVALAQGIASMLPDLIPLAISAILDLVDTLLNNADLIIDAGTSILLALIDGLIAAIPTLLSKMPVIVGKMASALLGCIPKFISAGGDMLAGLFQGLLNPTAIWNAVSSLFDGIVGGVKALFGIHSPSTVFRDVVGQNLALGLGEGFTDTMGDVTEDMANAIPTEFDTDLKVNATPAYAIEDIKKYIPNEIETTETVNVTPAYETVDIAEDMRKAIPTEFDVDAILNVNAKASIGDAIEDIKKSIPNEIDATIKVKATTSYDSDYMDSSVEKSAKDIDPTLITSIVGGFDQAIQNIKDSASLILQQIRGFGDSVIDVLRSAIVNVCEDIKKAIPTEFGARLNVDVGDAIKDIRSAIPDEIDSSVSIHASSPYGNNYDYIVNAFKQALKDVKVVMNNREMGAFVTETMERAVYS